MWNQSFQQDSPSSSPFTIPSVREPHSHEKPLPAPGPTQVGGGSGGEGGMTVNPEPTLGRRGTGDLLKVLPDLPTYVLVHTMIVCLINQTC